MRTVEIAGRSWQWSEWDRSCGRYLQEHCEDALAPLQFVPEDRRRVCVQAGGNFGVWPWLLSFKFEQVITFEPEPEALACLRANVADRDNITVHDTGLGDAPTRGEMRMVHRNHGAQHIKFGEGPVEVITLDSLGLHVLDYLDLDIEGAEPFALEGAKETIARCKPVIAVEDWTKPGRDGKPHPGHHKFNYGHGQSGAEWLLAHGYRQVARITQDSIFVPA